MNSGDEVKPSYFYLSVDQIQERLKEKNIDVLTSGTEIVFLDKNTRIEFGRLNFRFGLMNLKFDTNINSNIPIIERVAGKGMTVMIMRLAQRWDGKPSSEKGTEIESNGNKYVNTGYINKYGNYIYCRKYNTIDNHEVDDEFLYKIAGSDKKLPIVKTYIGNNGKFTYTYDDVPLESVANILESADELLDLAKNLNGLDLK